MEPGYRTFQQQGQKVEHVDLRHRLVSCALTNRQEHAGTDGGPYCSNLGDSHAFESSYNVEQGKDSLH